jgi:transcriptional regulator with XRE-family HTH domain
MKEYKSAYELLTDCPKELDELERRYAFTNKVNDRIKSEGWTLEQASDVMGFDISWLEDIQKGKLSNYYLDGLDRLCDSTNVTLNKGE